MTDLSRLSNDELFRMAGMEPPSGGLRVEIGPNQRPVNEMADDELFRMAGIEPNRVALAHRSAPQAEGDPLTEDVLRRYAPGVPSTADTLAQGVMQGATFNFGDEIIGAAAASGIPQAVTSALGGGRGAELAGAATRFPAAIAGAARLAAESVAPSVFGDTATRRYQEATEAARREMELGARVNPISSIVGQVAGGLALPVGGALGQAGNVGARALAGARVGVPLGAAYGAGEGTDLSERATNAATGAVVGGVLGGGINAALGPRLPVPRSSTAGPSGQEVVDAAGRIGVELPRAVTTDSMAVQRTAAGLRNVPIAGDPIVQGARRAQGQLNDAANRVATDMGSTSRAEAGATAATAIRDWTTTQSRQIVARAYDAVDGAITDPSRTTALNATQGAVASILARRTEGAMPGVGGAVDLVAEAVRRPGGLTYEGIKTLRTSIGEMMDNALAPASISQGELKQIYGALTEDLKAAVVNSGSPRALALWNRANETNRLVQARREEFARIIGKSGEASAEQVFDRMLQMASDSAGANLQRLMQARRVMQPDEWREVSGTLIIRLGRDAEGNFTPDRFLTAWGKLSDQGKNVLFGASGGSRQALDDIATISSRFKQLNQFANPSGTAQNVGFAGMGAGTFADPISAATVVLSGRVMASVLASPATAASMAKWARAYEVAVRRPAAGTVASLQSASRNFANTIGERLGVTVDPMDFLRAIQGAQPVRADGENEQRQ